MDKVCTLTLKPFKRARERARGVGASKQGTGTGTGTEKAFYVFNDAAKSAGRLARRCGHEIHAMGLCHQVAEDPMAGKSQFQWAQEELADERRRKRDKMEFY